MREADEQVALQAIEFWSTVCEREIEILDEALDVSRFLFLLCSRFRRG